MRKNQVLIQECRTVKQSDISIPTMKITIKPDFIIHNIAGEQVLIGMGEEVDFSKMLLLNDTAAYIITALQKNPLHPKNWLSNSSKNTMSLYNRHVWI